MKTLKFTLYILASLLCLTSCAKEDIDTFDTNYKALNIWFGTSNVVSEKLVHNYSYYNGETSLTFYARITGQPTDYDRTFTLEAYDGDVDKAKGSYRVEGYVIPAGKTTAQFKIYFDSSKLSNENLFSEEDGHLYFRMAENSEFKQGADGLNTLTVVLRNYLSKPEDWDTTDSYLFKPYKTYFGDYSKVKYRFIIENTGLVDFRISSTASVPYNESTNYISIAYATYLKQVLQIALTEYNNTHTTKLTDENGNLITF
jgi:hypothetical protein